MPSASIRQRLRPLRLIGRALGYFEPLLLIFAIDILGIVAAGARITAEPQAWP